MRRIAVFLAPSVAALGILSAPAAAGTPQRVVITSSAVCGSSDATFRASGGINDSGPAVFTVESPLAGPFGLTGSTLHGVGEFHGASGTFIVRWMFVLKATADPNVFAENGTWSMTAGSLNGEGRLSGTCTLGGNEDITWTGRVH